VLVVAAALALDVFSDAACVILPISRAAIHPAGLLRKSFFGPGSQTSFVFLKRRFLNIRAGCKCLSYPLPYD